MVLVLSFMETQLWVRRRAHVLLDMACALLRYVGNGREVQSAAYNLIKDWSLEEHTYLRESVPKMGLRTPFRDGTLQDVALKVRNPMLPFWDRVLFQVSCIQQHAEERPAEGQQQMASYH